MRLAQVVKVFSATMAKDRDQLGERVTAWLHDQPPKFHLDEIRTMQSSDQAFHCLSIIVLGQLEVAS